MALTDKYKKRLHLIFRILISGGILALLFSRIQFETMWEAIRTSSLFILLLTLFLSLFERFVMVVKLWVLYRAKEIYTSFWRLYKLILATTFVGKFAPTSLGVDMIRIYGLSRATKNTVESVSVILIDRFLAVVIILIMATIAFFSGDYLQQELQIYVAIGMLVCLLMVPIIGFSKRLRIRIGNILRKVRFIGKYVDMAGQVVHSFYEFRKHPLYLLILFGLSLVFQLGRVLVPFMVTRAMGISMPITYFFLFVPIVIVLAMLPLSIGGVGIREGGIAYFLVQGGATLDQAVGITVLIFVITLLAGLPGGFFYLVEGFGKVDKKDENLKES